MKRTLILIALTFALGCSEDEPMTEKRAAVRLVRAPGGEIALELDKAPGSVRAIEVELLVEGDSAFEITEAKPEKGLALDSVRVQMLGANRAVLFAGSKREVLIPRAGRVATFEARSSATSTSARISITRAVVASIDGARIDVDLGPGLALR